MKTTDSPIIVKESYSASAKEVWDAITILDNMKQWYFNEIPEFEAVVGFETSFSIATENRVFIHQWKVIEVDYLKRISYNWKYPDLIGDSNITFIITEIDNQTELTMTCDILEDFPSDIPEFHPDSCKAGWKYFLSDRLKNYLEN